MRTRQAWAHSVRTAVALVAAFFISACASWFGQAETAEQEAFRAMGRYVYLATPASNFANLAAPDTSILSAICTLDQSTHDAFQEVSNTLNAGGDSLAAALSGAASALASFSLEVLGQAVFPKSTNDIVGKSIVWTQVGTRSAASMRAWRKGYIKPKLEAMVARGLDPTPQDWTELQAQADTIHRSIQGRCLQLT